jgi:hypothetical protein
MSLRLPSSLLLTVLLVAACSTTKPLAVDVVPEPVAQTPAPVATQNAPEQPPEAPRQGADVPATCGGPVKKVVNALAIPHANQGTIELVVTDHPASCTYWTDPQRKTCDFWRARIYLPARAQKAGRYRIEQSFAYLDRKVTGPSGAWQSGGVCEWSGGDLTGDLDVLKITQDTIEARFCDTDTKTHNSKGLLDGTIVAKRCPACLTTGMACAANGECCTGNCVGHCGP